MARAALVDDTTHEVENIGPVQSPPPFIPGKRWIWETSWAIGSPPIIGKIWDGNDPATFSAAPPPPSSDFERSAQDLIEDMRVKAQELIAKADSLEAKLG